MTGILHMDTDVVRAVANQLDGAGQDVAAQLASLQSRLDGMSWLSPGRQVFDADAQGWLSSARSLAEHARALGRRLSDEVLEWEAVGAGISGRVGPGADTNPPRSDLGDVLGIAEESGINTSDPGALDWLGGVVDVLDKVAGQVAAKALIKQWLDAFGIALKGIDLATSAPEVSALNRAMYEAQSAYGSGSQEYSQARWDYSDAELRQVVPGVVYLALHTAGQWDDMVNFFIDQKYR